jgi:nicotinamidase-related amidase
MPATALIVIDMLNPYEHEDAGRLAENVAGIVQPLAQLIADAVSADGVHVVYVNDNHGDFGASRDDIAERALAGRRPDLVEPLLPDDGVDFLMKVRHSVFYSTALEYLLRRREIERVVLAGQVTEQCVLYSALDAYVRHFAIRVPCDAVAAIDPELGDAAMQMMERNMRADLVDAAAALD